MIKKVFTLFDNKAEVYLPPFFENTKGSAIRAIQDGMRAEGSMLSSHKKDLCLVHIGLYDDNIGEIKSVEKEVIGDLIDLDPILEKNNN